MKATFNFHQCRGWVEQGVEGEQMPDNIGLLLYSLPLGHVAAQSAPPILSNLCLTNAEELLSTTAMQHSLHTLLTLTSGCLHHGAASSNGSSITKLHVMTVHLIVCTWAYCPM